MKQLFFLLLLSLATLTVQAQNHPAAKPATTDTTPQQDTGLAEHGEAGGINASDTTVDEPPKTLADYWLYLVLGGLAIAGLTAAITRALSPKQKAPVLPEPETAIKETPKANSNTAENRQLKQELIALKAQLEALQGERDTLDKNLGIYRNFDNSYYNEAFRKLIAPMNEALDKGSRKEILENLLKMMMHFSSVTRYKIAKKQPYDEANIHYLLNQKGGEAAAATEITGETPVDKIPKNIKTIIDMLKEQDSRGLDDSILAGYKIKAL